MVDSQGTFHSKIFDSLSCNSSGFKEYGVYEEVPQYGVNSGSRIGDGYEESDDIIYGNIS